MSYDPAKSGGGNPPMQGQPPQEQYQGQYPGAPAQWPYPYYPGYPPPQGQPAYPPQQGYTQPPQGQLYGQPPPQAFQGQYGAPPPPPPPQGQQYYPPQSGYAQGVYGAPPQQPLNPPPSQYGAPPQPQQTYVPPVQSGPPTPPSPGYSPGEVSKGTMESEISLVRGAMNDKSGKALMKVLSDFDPVKMASLHHKYKGRIYSELAHDIKSLTQGDAENYLLFLIRGPLKQDVHYAHQAIALSNLKLLNDVLLCRSNADIKAIKHAYQQSNGVSLDAAIQSSTFDEKYKRLYSMVLSADRAEDSFPVDPRQAMADAKELQEATEGVRFGVNEISVFRILTSRNDNQLREIVATFQRDFHKSLENVLKGEFVGTAEDTVLLILDRAANRARSDAKMLEESMKGFGTDELLLESRVLRVHWDRKYLMQVKAEYKNMYGKDLIKKVKSETSRVREDFLVTLLD